MAKVKNIQLSFLSRPLPAEVEQKRLSSYDSYLERQIRQAVNNAEVLRWAIVDCTHGGGCNHLTVEATIIRDFVFPNDPYSKDFFRVPSRLPAPLFMHIVPTGIKAAVGGSLGDAFPVNLALSRLGSVISHPNTFNGGSINSMDPTMQYCEGKMLDDFSRGKCFINPLNPCGEKVGKQNKIAVILDSGMDAASRRSILYQINAFQATQGAQIIGCVWTSNSIGGHGRRLDSGAFVGDVEDLDTLIEAAQRAKKLGADAIAVFTHIDIEEEHLIAYFKGEGANPFGGHEAIISHTIVSLLGIPAAHGPVLTEEEVAYLRKQEGLAPEAAGEGALPFYAFSVLKGLQYAPQIVSSIARVDLRNPPIAFTSVNAILCPASSMGGIPMMAAHHLKIPVIGIRENSTVLQVFPHTVGLYGTIVVANYLQAIGLLMSVYEKEGEVTVDRLQAVFRKNLISEYELYGRIKVEQVGINPDTLRRPSKIIK